MPEQTWNIRYQVAEWCIVEAETLEDAIAAFHQGAFTFDDDADVEVGEILEIERG